MHSWFCAKEGRMGSKYVRMREMATWQWVASVRGWVSGRRKGRGFALLNAQKYGSDGASHTTSHGDDDTDAVALLSSLQTGNDKRQRTAAQIRPAD
ncbi:uncharacterized protein SPSK_03779 [Sporothrix schenckii 1099-18]|uniref:Uncharacterized protein n=1 Tax=Sporothrix schenckii 1099-18 TaxID=1397361 RepID=A0A0F2LXR8_SPOSC|nr:uncharacterized protein SPSK_03779 [Sporothrix schenckii 1099-18]KJR82262.1 hypothetical protein SPSK_03779 [Sporothrix schenckii 1099-18]